MEGGGGLGAGSSRVLEVEVHVEEVRADKEEGGEAIRGAEDPTHEGYMWSLWREGTGTSRTFGT